MRTILKRIISKMTPEQRRHFNVFVSNFFDPLILWCYGWKSRKWKHVLHNKVWEDPETGYLWQRDAAIQKLERRIKNC